MSYWMSGWTNDGWRVDARMVNLLMYMNEWIDKWMIKWVDKWMNEWKRE